MPEEFRTQSLFVFWNSVSEIGHDAFGSFDQNLGPRDPERVPVELQGPDLPQKTQRWRNVFDVVVLERKF